MPRKREHFNNLSKRSQCRRINEDCHEETESHTVSNEVIFEKNLLINALYV